MAPHSTVSPVDPSSLLDALDAALVDIRRAPQRAGYRRRLRAALDVPMEPGTVRALRSVERARMPPSIGEIAEALGIDPSSASRMVDRCISDRLLRRRPSTKDRRRIRVELTDTGHLLLEQATRARRGLLAEVTAGWPRQDLERLVTALNALQIGFDRFEAKQ